MRRFGLKPSVALVSHSSFGSSDAPSAQKMRDALELILARAPDLESKARCAATRRCRRRSATRSSPTRASADANLLVMPNVDAANITYNAARDAGHGITVGGILLGAASRSTS